MFYMGLDDSNEISFDFPEIVYSRPRERLLISQILALEGMKLL